MVYPDGVGRSKLSDYLRQQQNFGGFVPSVGMVSLEGCSSSFHQVEQRERYRGRGCLAWHCSDLEFLHVVVRSVADYLSTLAQRRHKAVSKFHHRGTRSARRRGSSPVGV